MAKALIICAAGMSSSLMAKKTTEFLKAKGEDVEVDAISATEGGKAIADANFDLYLISPQAYIPIPMGIEKMANLIKENI